MSIKDTIKEKKPDISDSSITTYDSILRNVYKNVFGHGEIDLSNFDDSTKILEYLKDKPSNKRKTILSALVLIATDKKPYRDLMLSDISDYNTDIKKQEKTESQKENWISKTDIEYLINELKENADLIYKKKKLSMNDLQNIQSYIIMCLLSGFYIPPRRSKDYTHFIIKDYDKEIDNFLDKNKLYFNNYKTASTYGKQVVEIPIILKNILNKWIKVNTTKFLLFDNKFQQLSSIKLNQRLNKLFGNKKISVNMLRHIYLTSKYEDTIKLNEEIAHDMAAMGSSAQQLSNYVKK